ncbi:MAG: hypothetical protein LBQ18_00305 [Campylobacteraceae bacterium]|nr:hypothetical protein [Campylobacteraceae bacterium]
MFTVSGIYLLWRVL